MSARFGLQEVVAVVRSTSSSTPEDRPRAVSPRSVGGVGAPDEAGTLPAGVVAPPRGGSVALRPTVRYNLGVDTGAQRGSDRVAAAVGAGAVIETVD